MIKESQLLAILRIGHETSLRGEGISLQQAIAKTKYKRLRRSFSASDLTPLIRSHPEFITQWILYCEDKRTSGGYWIDSDALTVGSLEAEQIIAHYRSLEEAVANYVINELDCWARIE